MIFILDYASGSKEEQLVIRAIQEGHTVGLHGTSHDYPTIYSSVEALMYNFTSLQEKVYNSTGYYANIIRFPGGSSNTVSMFNKGIMSILTKSVKEKGYHYFDWNVDSGDADVRDDSKLFLQKIASLLVKDKYNTIEIEGHTDNVPISTSQFENNLQLSAERARSVYEYIITQENFIEENIKIAGYGDKQPVASNATEEGRAKNRRVVIKIYNKQNSN